jgi:hypothetical protein
MSTGQIIVVAVSIVVVVLIALFYNKMPEKLKKALLTSMIFVFSAILLINVLRSQIVGFTDRATFITKAVFVVVFAVMSFLVVYLVKDEERQRKVFLCVAAFIFGFAYLWFITQMINGFTQGRASAFPSHLCRQIGYGFPLIYFSKWGRRFVLPYFVYAGIIGAIATLYVPNNILNNDIISWGDFDKVVAHVLLLWVPVVILATKEVRPVFWHMLYFAIGLAASTLFAILSNAIEFWQAGTFGNGMYLRTPVEPWFPTWLFAIVVFVVAYAIITPFAIINRKRKMQETQAKVEKTKPKKAGKAAT